MRALSSTTRTPGSGLSGTAIGLPPDNLSGLPGFASSAGKSSESDGAALSALLANLFVCLVFGKIVSLFNATYKVEADSVVSHRFDLKSLAVETRRTPTDQIQGVSIDQKGILNQLLGIGTIRIKTAAIEGELILENVNAPSVLAQEIQKLRERTTARMSGREREEMRRNLENSGLGKRRPRMLRSNRDSRGPVSPTALKVRKSPVILLSHILLPVALGVFLILVGLHFALVTPLLIWIVYHFEVWRGDFFLASRGYITRIHRRLFGRSVLRHQIEVTSLQNIRTEQRGILSLMFGYGDVILVTTGGAADITLKNVSNPQKVQEAFFRYRDDERQRREHVQNTAQVKALTQLAHALRQIEVN